MRTVLVTGSRGFIGRNLCSVLRLIEDVSLLEYDLHMNPSDLLSALGQADFIIHLAGVNRPQNVDDFRTGNTCSTEDICAYLLQSGRVPKIVLSSSIQAEQDNPYGQSKRAAEEVLRGFSAETGAECVVHRFKNLFGKWCRPNYNSVTATFCHNIAHDLPIHITDPARELEFTYIDDVVSALVGELQAHAQGFRFAETLPGITLSLAELAAKITAFRDIRRSLQLPDLSSAFDRALYATYLSHLDPVSFGYDLDAKSDHRGSLAEFIKSPAMGQIFLSRTAPGVTRGNHYHHTKVEKFLVVQGEGIIRFRHIEGSEVIQFSVRGEDYHVLDIPPGYTHSIENVGQDELVTLFWSSQVFDVDNPDTFFLPVLDA